MGSTLRRSTLRGSTLRGSTLWGPKTQHLKIGRSRNWPKLITPEKWDLRCTKKNRHLGPCNDALQAGQHVSALLRETPLGKIVREIDANVLSPETSEPLRLPLSSLCWKTATHGRRTRSTNPSTWIRQSTPARQYASSCGMQKERTQQPPRVINGGLTLEPCPEPPELLSIGCLIE